MSQNRNRKSSSNDKTCGSILSRHRPDAQGALQQSLILQSDMDKIIKMNYNGKCEVTLRSVVRSESLRPFTQLDEQTPEKGYLPCSAVVFAGEALVRTGYSSAHQALLDFYFC